MKNKLKDNWKRILGFAVLILILLVIFIGKGNGDEGITKHTMAYTDVSDRLVLTGEARPVNGAEMAFEASGVVAGIYKAAGDKVYTGEKIVELDNASLRADLADAVANLELTRAEARVSNAESDQDVSSAYSKLLSDGLEAYSKDLDISDNAPTISGSYIGGTPGEYKITIEYSNSTSHRKMRYFGLEKGEVDILYYKAVPLGTKGLFIKFNEGEASVGDSWTVSIPNIESASYVENLNAYESALASRDAAESVNVSLEISNARIKQAEAGVQKIQAQINERTLRAPFDGVVAKVDIKKGEIAEAGRVVTGVISDNAYEVVVEVPEVDIIDLAVNLPADIRLDAYGDDVIFPGSIFSIDPAETEVDGVSIYRAKVNFTSADPRIRSGMTAKVSILKDMKVGVLALPERFIEEDETGEFVMLQKSEEETEKVYITTGLRGSDGFVEVVSGLSEGDIIIGEFAE